MQQLIKKHYLVKGKDSGYIANKLSYYLKLFFSLCRIIPGLRGNRYVDTDY